MAKKSKTVDVKRGRMTKAEIEFIVKHASFGVEKLVKETGRSAEAINRVLNLEKTEDVKVPLKGDLTLHKKGATIMTPAASQQDRSIDNQTSKAIPRDYAEYIRPAKDE